MQERAIVRQAGDSVIAAEEVLVEQVDEEVLGNSDVLVEIIFSNDHGLGGEVFMLLKKVLAEAE